MYAAAQEPGVPLRHGTLPMPMALLDRRFAHGRAAPQQEPCAAAAAGVGPGRRQAAARLWRAARRGRRPGVPPARAPGVPPARAPGVPPARAPAGGRGGRWHGRPAGPGASRARGHAGARPGRRAAAALHRPSGSAPALSWAPAWARPGSCGERRYARRRAGSARGAGVTAIAFAEGRRRAADGGRGRAARMALGAGAPRGQRAGRLAGARRAGRRRRAAAGRGRAGAAAQPVARGCARGAAPDARRRPCQACAAPSADSLGGTGAGPGGGGRARGAGARHAARARAAAQLRGAQGGRACRRARRPRRLLRACTCAPPASSPCRPRLRSVLLRCQDSGRASSVRAGDRAPRAHAPAALARGASPAGAPRCC